MKLKHDYEDELTEFISSTDSLYHFTRKDTAIEHILNNQTIRFGDFKLTNDPQEYKQRMTSVVGCGWEDDFLDKIPEITRTIDDIIKSSGFISLCQNRYDKDGLTEEGCFKSRMWSQYGDNHSGICLVFSKGLLLKEIDNTLSNEYTILSNSVVYKNSEKSRVRDGLRVNGDELSESTAECTASKYVIDSNKSIFFQKQPDYKDENEFRVIAVTENGKSACGQFVNINSSLKAIILGDAFPKVYLPTIKALSEALNVPCRKLHWEKGVYKLLR